MMRLPEIERDIAARVVPKCGLGQSTPNCPTCGQQMDSLFNGRKTTCICARCEQVNRKTRSQTSHEVDFVRLGLQF